MAIHCQSGLLTFDQGYLVFGVGRPQDHEHILTSLQHWCDHFIARFSYINEPFGHLEINVQHPDLSFLFASLSDLLSSDIATYFSISGHFTNPEVTEVLQGCTTLFSKRNFSFKKETLFPKRNLNMSIFPGAPGPGRSEVATGLPLLGTYFTLQVMKCSRVWHFFTLISGLFTLLK